jgi:uncharacterized membrane protein HdeD (DUF308 family)
MLVPFVAGPAALWLLGLVVATAGVLQMLQGFDQPDGTLRRSSFYGGGMSVGIGGLLLISPTLVASGLALLLAGSFILDGCSQLLSAWRNRAEPGWMVMATYGSGNVLIGMLTALQWPLSGAVASRSTVRRATRGSTACGTPGASTASSASSSGG